METWLDVRPLRIPRPKLSGSSSEPKDPIDYDHLRDPPPPAEVTSQKRAGADSCAN